MGRMSLQMPIIKSDFSLFKIQSPDAIPIDQGLSLRWLLMRESASCAPKER